MKIKTMLTLWLFLLVQIVAACPLCEKQQPKLTRGLTHGAGPASDWDWLIVSIMAAFTVLTFVLSLKYLCKPGEGNADHIKQTILIN